LNKKTPLILFFLFFALVIRGQNLFLAEQYLKDGEDEKALRIYLEWFDKYHRYNQQIYDQVLGIYIRKGQYPEAMEWIDKVSVKIKSPAFIVDKFHLYRLMKDEKNARLQFEKLINKIKANPFVVNNMVYRLKKYNYLDEALEIIDYGLKIKESASLYLLQVTLYAEKGDSEKMAEAILKTLELNNNYFHYVTGRLKDFIASDPAHKYNMELKTRLIRKIQNNPNPAWLRLLHWIYVREGNFRQAFIQLRGLYLQGHAGPVDLFNLAENAYLSGKLNDAVSILNYINSLDDISPRLQDKIALLFTRIENKNPDKEGQEILALWKKRAEKVTSPHIKAEIYQLIADRLIYNLKDFDRAEQLLDSLALHESRDENLSIWKEKLADIKLLQKQFDQAALEYTLIREDFPYEEINYRALYKIALASFFSGDYDWAHTTLKTLKKAADKKIANDALRLDFIIIANRTPGDTIHEGLKRFSDIYFDYYARNFESGLRKIKQVKPLLKGQKIYDDLIYLEAKILWDQGKITDTEPLWNEILTFPTDKIYREEALYRLGIIYEEFKNDYEGAKAYFKRILLEYPQSFWYEPARKHYRKLKQNQAI